MSQGTRTETGEASHAAATAPQFIVSELVPEGRALIPVQTAGRTYLVVNPNAEIGQLVEELNAHVQHAQAVGFVVPYNGVPEGRDHPSI